MLRTLIVPIILVDFEFRQDYIAKYLCENRYKPLTLCNGKCFLAKKLKSYNQASDSAANQRFFTKLLELGCLNSLAHFSFLTAPRQISLVIKTQYKTNLFSQSFVTALFRPPIAF